MKLIILFVSFFIISCCNNTKVDTIGPFSDDEKKYIKEYTTYKKIVFKNSNNNYLTFNVNSSGEGYLYDEKVSYFCAKNKLMQKSIQVDFSNDDIKISLKTEKYNKENKAQHIFTLGYTKKISATESTTSSISFINKIFKNDTTINGVYIQKDSFKSFSSVDSTYLIIEPYKGLTMFKLKNDTSIYYLKP